jgi:GT2 family glycosyltransferase
MKGNRYRQVIRNEDQTRRPAPGLGHLIGEEVGDALGYGLRHDLDPGAGDNAFFRTRSSASDGEESRVYGEHPTLRDVEISQTTRPIVVFIAYVICAVGIEREYDLALSTWRPRRLAGKLVAWMRGWRGTGLRAYQSWIKRFDAVTPELRAALVADISRWPSRPLISVIMPSYNIDPRWLSQAIDSVRNQIYPHWELCISDDASTNLEIRPLLEEYAARDPRIRVTFRAENGHISVNSNAALDLANGDYIALLDADDLLSEDALFWVGREIVLHPEADLIFSDEDKIDEHGTRFDPFFKSAWNPALMLSQNAFCHLGIYRRRLVENVGRFRKGYEGSQDHDLVLRCAAKTTPDRIRHIPRVLYHWRALPSSTATEISAKSYAWEAGRRAIADYLHHIGASATVNSAARIYYQVDYEMPRPARFVSLVIPTILSGSIPAKCIQSVLSRSSYQNFELLILAHANHVRAGEKDPQFARILADGRVRIVEHAQSPFNFSSVCNLGASSSRGDILCFLNDDVEVITQEWIEKLVARVSLEGVGAAGPMLYYPSSRIQHAGVILGLGGVADHAFKHMRRGNVGPFGRGGLEQDYSCVTAACIVIRRKAFEDVGGFDEALPVAFNDVDFCIKLRRSGARIIWTPTVEMYHHESLTFGHHDAPARRAQFQHDVRLMRERWGGVLDSDPCYNPNLGVMPGSVFSLAWPPRFPDAMQIVDGLGRTSISRTSQLTPIGT